MPRALCECRRCEASGYNGQKRSRQVRFTVGLKAIGKSLYPIAGGDMDDTLSAEDYHYERDHGGEDCG